MNARRLLLPILIILVSATCAARVQDVLHVHFFYGRGCPHCCKEEHFLRQCEQRYANLRVHRYEVYFHPENMALLRTTAERLKATSAAVPLLILGRTHIAGYDSDLTPTLIRMEIEKCILAGCPDIVGEIVHGGRQGPGDDETPSPAQAPRTTFTIPILGDIDVRTFSLPLLTMVMGFLDGFNPCAMWALVFLIGLLLGMRNRGRMWLFGLTFIAASAFVYFLFMAAWLNIILFFGLVMWVRVAIGFVALTGGAFSIKDALTREEISCKISGDAQRRNFRVRLRRIVGQHNLFLALGGIVLLAFMVNLVEIVCSAGFPAIYTQVLSLNALPAWQYYAFILLYILFFMLDDMIVFAAAMATLEITGATTRYVRWARLVGGVLMLLVGALLILRPQWLMFG